MRHAQALRFISLALLAAPCCAQHWFDALSIYPLPNGVYRGAADLGGDARPELIGVSGQQWFVHQLSGAGDPSVVATVATAGPLSFGPFCGDFDGDAVPDVVWLEYFGQPNAAYRIAWHRGLGGFAYAPAVYQSLSLPVEHAVSADFDANGRPDIAVLTRSPSGLFTQLGWYRIHAGMWRATEVAVNDLTSAKAIAPLDFDADGRADLAAPNGSVLRIYTSSTGVPQWTASVALPSALAAPFTSVRGADFDGDGDGDVLVHTTSTPTALALVVQLAPSNLGLASVQFGTSTTVFNPVTGDWDADGDLDLALTTLVFEHAGQDFDASIGFPPAQAVSQNTAAAMADFDLDGHADLLGFEWIRWGDGTFGIPPQGPIVVYPSNDLASFAVDLDADGDCDGINFAGQAVGAGAAWSLQALALPALAANETWRTVAAADFDGDATTDLLASKWVTGPFTQQQMGVHVLRGDGLGRWPIADAVPVAASVELAIGYYARQRVVDAEGDGDLDVLLRKGFAWDAGDATFPVVGGIATYGIHDSADLDGDGDQDLLGWPAATGSVNDVLSFTQQAPQSFVGQPITVGGAWGEVRASAADVDADGDIDVVLCGGSASPSQLQLALVLNQGGSWSTQAPIVLGAAGVFGMSGQSTPVHAVDIDQDGQRDLVLAGAQRTVVLRRSGAALVYEPPRVFALGTGDIEDFDRDGDLDLASTVGFTRNVAHDDASFGLVEQYGQATAGTSGVAPVLGLAGAPRVGEAVELRVRYVSASGPALLAMSSASAALPGVPVPSITLALDLVGLAPLVGVGLAPTGGASKGAVLPYVIPPGAGGLDIYLQAFVLDALAPHGLSASRGLRVRIAQ